MVATKLIQTISTILTEAQIEHLIDPDLKRFDGNKPYYALKKSPRRILFTDFFRHGFLQAIVPNTLAPETVNHLYGIQGQKDPANEYCNYSHHYLLRIPYTKFKDDVLIGGKYYCHDKKGFFIDVAKKR